MPSKNGVQGGRPPYPPTGPALLYNFGQQKLQECIA